MCYPISGHHTSQTLTSANQPAKNAALIRRPLAYSNKNDDDNGEGDGAGIDEVGKKIQGRELTLMPNLWPPRVPNFGLRPSAGQKCCPCLPPPVPVAIKTTTTMVRVMVRALMRSATRSKAANLP